MRKTLGVLAAAFLAAGVAVKVCRADDAKEGAPAAAAKADDKKADAGTGKKEQPEFLEFKQTGKMAAVKFPHKLHSDKLKGCKDCHEGEKPIFVQKFDDAKGMKMADFYKGEACGACHDGKKEVDGKKVFAAKAGCMKCHKKAEEPKK